MAVLAPLAVLFAETPSVWLRTTVLAAIPTGVVLLTVYTLDFHLETGLAFTCLFALFGIAGARLMVLARRGAPGIGLIWGVLVMAVPVCLLVAWTVVLA
jgi:hypothetical protein